MKRKKRTKAKKGWQKRLRILKPIPCKQCGEKEIDYKEDPEDFRCVLCITESREIYDER